MARADRDCQEGSGPGPRGSRRRAGGLPSSAPSALTRIVPNTPSAARSPLYEASHSDRYQRQALIREYQEKHHCRLVVVRDALFPRSIPLLEETVFDANPEEDLHLILVTQGGDGETALRLIRQIQARCRGFTVIVPDQAKSAGTLLVLGAHHIYMGPTSDLGPVDPQFLLADGSLASARAIIAAVERAEASVQQNPGTYPLHASLLDPVTALMVEQARDQLARTDDLVREALASVPDRSEDDVTALFDSLKDPLIEASRSHGAADFRLGRQGIWSAGRGRRAGQPALAGDLALVHEVRRVARAKRLRRPDRFPCLRRHPSRQPGVSLRHPPLPNRIRPAGAPAVTRRSWPIHRT